VTNMQNLDYIREQLHLPENLIALNVGSWGPLCEASRKALVNGYKEEAYSRGENIEFMKQSGSGLTRYSDVLSDARDVLGGFLRCEPSEVAMCDSTTSGMNIFLWGYDWKQGDTIIAGSYENNAAKVPLAVLAKRRDVRIKYIDQTGNFSEALKEEITKNTKMVLISDVNYVTGSRVDLKAISDVTHDKGALVLADGIQAVGTVPVDVKKLGVDGYAMARHKFMCGPDGAGGLYVNREVFDVIQPTFSGVFTDSAHGSGELHPADSAQRYEVSTRALPVIQGGTAAVKWLTEEVGLEYIYDKSEKLYKKLWVGLNEIDGVELISGENQSSLLSFRVKEIVSSDVSKKLIEWNIFTRTVEVIEPSSIRVSLGFWNRESDVDKILEAVGEIASG